MHLLHRIMNSHRVLAGCCQPPLAANFAQQLLGSVRPADRLSASVALGEEAQDALADMVGTLEVVGRQGLPLQFAEHDLDLVQPGGVDRQPMEVDGKRQVQAREPRPQALGRVRGAVVQDEVEAANPAAARTLPKTAVRRAAGGSSGIRRSACARSSGPRFRRCAPAGRRTAARRLGADSDRARVSGGRGARAWCARRPAGPGWRSSHPRRRSRGPSGPAFGRARRASGSGWPVPESAGQSAVASCGIARA